MGYFIRPKASTRDDSRGMVHVEAVGVVEEYENEYIPASGFDSTVHGKSGSAHYKDAIRREAEPGAPLPGGNWRG